MAIAAALPTSDDLLIHSQTLTVSVAYCMEARAESAVYLSLSCNWAVTKDPSQSQLAYSPETRPFKDDCRQDWLACYQEKVVLLGRETSSFTTSSPPTLLFIPSALLISLDYCEARESCAHVESVWANRRLFFAHGNRSVERCSQFTVLSAPSKQPIPLHIKPRRAGRRQCDIAMFKRSQGWEDTDVRID